MIRPQSILNLDETMTDVMSYSIRKEYLVQIKNCLSEHEASQFLVWLTAELEALKRLV